MKKALLIIAMCGLAGSVSAQESFSSVEERMTGKEFMETGLSKLTDEELAKLNQWLRAHSVATLDAAVPGRRPVAPGGQVAVTDPVEDTRGLKKDEGDYDDIVTRIDGEFSGWDGETIFRLENGMVWKQAQTDRFFTKTMTNPEVRIKSTMFGAWRMEVEGYNKSVKVER
ncbi:MAG: hypothetical protein HKO64_03605, partial [Xanthomonadales bacterium]|nr:hypothetical protein [Xanthomonadales bacterium]